MNQCDHQCSDGKCGGCLSCQLAQAQHTNTELHNRLGELERLRKENDILRGIATKIMPCHYCGVDHIAKCPHGFPGCSLADDLSCAEDCMAQEIIKLRKEINRLKPPCSLCRDTGIVDRMNGEQVESEPCPKCHEAADPHQPPDAAR